MGLLRNRGGDEGDGAGSRYQMREKLLSIGDDYWIEDDDGNRAFHVDGKALRVRQTFVIEDAAGNEVAKIQERKLSVRDKMEIERGEDSLATVKKALVGLRDRFSIDLENGGEMKAKGNIVDHEYEVERDGDTSPRVEALVQGPRRPQVASGCLRAKPPISWKDGATANRRKPGI